MINLDSITNENNKKHNEKWPFISDHRYRILIIGSSGSGKTNVLLNLIKQQDDIDKMYLYVKDLNKPKYEFLIKKCEDAGTKYFSDPNSFTVVQIQWMTFMRMLMTTNQTDKEKFQLCLMIADIMSNKKIQAIIKELLIRCRKLNISLMFITVLFFCSKKC